jgi:hypothetical protein
MDLLIGCGRKAVLPEAFDAVVALVLEELRKGFVPHWRAPRSSGSAGELALMKAWTWIGRDEDKDVQVFKFLITKMEENRVSFGLPQPADAEKMEDPKVLLAARKKAGAAHEALLEEDAGLASGDRGEH